MCPSCMDLYVIHVFWNYIKILFLVQTISCLSSLSEPISHDFIVSLVLSLASFEDRNSRDWCLWFSIESVKLFIGRLLWWKHDFAICLGISFPLTVQACLQVQRMGIYECHLQVPSMETKLLCTKVHPVIDMICAFYFQYLKMKCFSTFLQGFVQLIGEIPLWSAVLNAPHWGFSRPPIGA